MVLSSPEAERISDGIMVAAFYLWVNYGILGSAGINLLMGGLNKTDVAALEKRIVGPMRGTPLLVGLVIWRLPGPYGLFGILTAMLVIFGNTRFALWHIAYVRRERAPRAYDQTCESDSDSSLIIQISDVHATAERSKRTDGGSDGTESMEALTRGLLQSKVPQFLLVTGDLIDRGTEAEWVGVLPFIQQFRKAGCRVLITPGNHDIATAYDPWPAEHFGKAVTGTIRPVDARKLIVLLRHTADVEPELQTCDGTLLRDFVDKATHPVEALEATWRAVREQALGILRNDPAVDGWVTRRLENQGPHQVFFHLGVSHPSDVRRIMDQFISQAESVFRPPEIGPMTAVDHPVVERLFRRSADWSLPATLLGRHWMKQWYRPFPLRLVVPADQLEFLILNSNAPEPGVIGSAFGRLGNEQLERLRVAVSSTPARTLVVLMHHPICAWNAEPADKPDFFRVSIGRWAVLAHDSVEARELTQLLETAAPATCKRIFLCGGHRHGISHAGPVLLDAAGSITSRLRVLESGALPDLYKPKRNVRAGNGLLALRPSIGEEFKVIRIPWSRLT